MARLARWELATPTSDRRRWAWLAEVTPTNAVAFVLVVALLGLIGVLKVLVEHRPPLDAVLPALAPLFIFGCLVRGEAVGRPHRRLRARLRAASRRTAHPVRLTLLRDERPYGGDDGIVSFEDGALVYRGVGTAFRLLPADVSVPPEAFARGPLMGGNAPDWRYGNHSGGSAWGFRLAAETDVRVYLFPLKARGFPSVYRPLYAWLTAPPAASGDTTLPPLDPLPGYVPPRPLAPRKRA